MKKKYRNICLVLCLIAIDIMLISLILMPKILSFSKYDSNIQFRKFLGRIDIYVDYIQMSVATIINVLAYIILYRTNTKYVRKYINDRDETIKDTELIKKVRNECINAPYSFMKYGLTAIIIVLSIAYIVEYIVFTAFSQDTGRLGSLFVFLISSCIIILNLNFIFFKNYLLEILKDTYVDKKESGEIGKRINSIKSIITQVAPFVIALLMLYACVAYSETYQIKSETIKGIYLNVLEQMNFESYTVEDIQNKLENEDMNLDYVTTVIIDPNNNIYFSNEDATQLNDVEYYSYYTIKYKDFLVMNNVFDNLVYESTMSNKQIICIEIRDENNNAWYVGYEVDISEVRLESFYVLWTLIIFFLFYIMLYIWSSYNTKTEKEIVKNMKALIDNDELIHLNYIPVLSNDELGDITINYNKIQDKMVEQQELIIMQEKMRVIGEVSAGIAHDINTPMSSINTGIRMLRKECNDSDERMSKILDSMQVSSDRVIEIVTSMRNQVRNTGNPDEEFCIDEILKDLKVIINNKLQKAGCVLDINMINDIKLHGEKTKMSQVITNIVVNSIQAYAGNNLKGSIDITVYQKGDKNYIIISDQAGGMPERIAANVFKKIETTKGSEGTGLGLYLSYMYIKSTFKGNMILDNTPGIGCKFTIELPVL